jgi:hypothetical protein
MAWGHEVISNASHENIERAFHRAIRGNVLVDADDGCIIEPDAGDSDPRATGQKVLVITLSSFVFRLLVIFRMFEDSPTRDYYLTQSSVQSLDDILAETTNMCSGALSRELSLNFPHLAMSTPSPLDSRCIGLLRELKPQRLSSYRITIKESVTLRATLCLCCSAPIEVAAAAELTDLTQEHGELELF